jgi:hypothetical protein
VHPDALCSGELIHPPSSILKALSDLQRVFCLGSVIWGPTDPTFPKIDKGHGCHNELNCPARATTKLLQKKQEQSGLKGFELKCQRCQQYVGTIQWSIFAWPIQYVWHCNCVRHTKCCVMRRETTVFFLRIAGTFGILIQTFQTALFLLLLQKLCGGSSGTIQLIVASMPLIILGKVGSARWQWHVSMHFYFLMAGIYFFLNAGCDRARHVTVCHTLCMHNAGL